ncbi:MAG: GAF and ANTAR domain-containing protein [Acidimicrobiales bacterium]
MPGNDLERAAAEFAHKGVELPRPGRVGEICRDTLHMTGAGIMLIAGGGVQGSLGTTDPVSTLIEELQYSLGEGPCLDAYRQDQVVVEPDLSNPSTNRWPAFTYAALRGGAQAVFAIPLRTGGLRLGSLDLYMNRPSSLSEDQLADGIALAGLVAAWVLDAQGTSTPSALSELLTTGDFHLAVHNAAGMVSVQLGVPIAEALLLLRAHAFAQGVALNEAADDVITSRLRFR